MDNVISNINRANTLHRQRKHKWSKENCHKTEKIKYLPTVINQALFFCASGRLFYGNCGASVHFLHWCESLKGNKIHYTSLWHNLKTYFRKILKMCLFRSFLYGSYMTCNSLIATIINKNTNMYSCKRKLCTDVLYLLVKI